MNFTKQQLKEIYELFILEDKVMGPSMFRAFLNKSNLFTEYIDIFKEFRDKEIDFTQFSNEKRKEIEHSVYCKIIDNLPITEIKNLGYQNSAIESLSEVIKPFSQKEENRKIMIDYMEQASYFSNTDLDNVYFDFVESKWINPLKNEDTLNNFKKFIDHILKLKDSYEYRNGINQLNIQKTQDRVLIVLDNLPLDIEYKKLIFCEYLELNQTIDLNNYLLKEIHNKYKETDFTAYYQKYNQIKTYYEDGQEDIILNELKVNNYKYILPKIVENSNVLNNSNTREADKNSYMMELKNNFLQYIKIIDEKAVNYPEIKNIHRIIADRKVELYIAYEEKNMNTEIFFKTYEMFIDVAINNALEKKVLAVHQKKEEWDTIETFNKMNIQVKEKTTKINRKKV